MARELDEAGESGGVVHRRRTDGWRSSLDEERFLRERGGRPVSEIRTANGGEDGEGRFVGRNRRSRRTKPARGTGTERPVGEGRRDWVMSEAP